MSYVLEFSASSVQMCRNLFFSSNRSQENMIIPSNRDNVYIPLSEWADSQQNVTAAPERQGEWTCVGQIFRPTSFRDSASHNEISLLLLSARSAEARSVSPPHAEEALQQKCLEVTQSTRTHPAAEWTVKTWSCHGNRGAEQPWV